MCCLFGLIDYRGTLTARQKNRILSIMAAACEARGTDATGIAYNSHGRLRIYKRPVPGHWMRFNVPGDARAIMGHTRMTTQGSAEKNYNNHPFHGSGKNGPFALAHNGVIYNDDVLRRTHLLPKTNIETDSFIGVQLIEQKKTLSFDSLRYMAEQLRGSFTFTVLDANDDLYVIKGDNPMCLYHFPTLGLYLYASTEAILKQALYQMRLPSKKPVSIPMDCGDILKIDSAGKLTWSRFNDSNLFFQWYAPAHARTCADSCRKKPRSAADSTYFGALKDVALAFGYEPEDIDKLAGQGFTPEEIEEFLYCGEV